MTARALPARPARFLLGAGSTALALALGGAPLVLTATAHAAPSKDTITICHATGSDGKPYVTNHPSRTADAGGHDSHGYTKKTHALLPVYHVGITGEWGDIIPPFDYPATKKYPAGHYAGLNWTTDGQAIFNNGCALPSSGGTTGGTTGDTSTGGSTGDTSTGGSTGDTSTGGSTGDTSTGGSTGDTSTGGSTGDTSTGGSTGDTSTGGSTGGTSTGGGTTAGTTGDITGGGTGATVTPVVTTPQPAHKPVTGGGGAVTAAKTLPFTGDRTSSLALWGFASLLGGVGFTALGGRKAQRVR